MDSAKETALIISNEEMNGIMKILSQLKNSSSLIKGVSETIKNEVKKQKGGFFEILVGSVDASLLGNLLTGESTIRTSHNF